MKTKHKLIIIIITVLIMAGIIIQPFEVMAYGYSPKEISFTHGECTLSTNIGNEQTVYSNDSTDIINYIQFTFDAYYTGTVKLTYTYSSTNPFANLNEWNVLVIGGKISARSNSGSSAYITFSVTDRNEFIVIMTYNMSSAITTITAGSNTIFTFSSATSSLTAVTNHNSQYDNIKDIDTQLVDANTNLSSIITRLTTANGMYADILQNTNDIESYLSLFDDAYSNTIIEQRLDSITTNTASIYSEQTDCNNILTDIYSSIGAIDPNSSDMDIISAINLISYYQPILSTNVSNMYLKIQDALTALNDINTTLLNIKADISGILNVANNIDDLVDTISWTDINAQIKWSETLNVDYDNMSTDNILSGSVKKIYLYIPINTEVWANNNTIIKISTQIYMSSQGNYTMSIKPYGFSNNNTVNQADYNYYYDYNRPYSTLYIYNNLNYMANGGTYLVLEVTTTSALRYYKVYDEFSYITSDDIEYWQLLSYFNEYNYYKSTLNYESVVTSKLDDILTAINNIHINVTQNDIENVTNNFDNDITTIHNVELSFDSDFGDYNSSLSDSDITLDLTPYSGTFSLVKTNITSLWQSDLIKIPILLSCLVFVFLVILG